MDQFDGAIEGSSQSGKLQDAISGPTLGQVPLKDSARDPAGRADKLWIAFFTVVLLGSAAVVGCSTRQVPHHFSAPMVGGVHAADPIAPRVAAPAKKKRARTKKKPVVVASSPISRDQNLAATQTRKRRPAASIGGAPLETGKKQTGKKQTVRAVPKDAPLSEVLRGLVGRRDKVRSHSQFALESLASLGLSLARDHELASIEVGRDLIRVASARSAVSSKDTALLGDLVVFDGVVSTLPASLIGVVIGQRADGTIEFIYLARGVVRRGWVNPRRPNDKRDAKGTVLNTFVRHSNGGDRGGTRYLAGQLHSSIIRLNRLLNPS